MKKYPEVITKEVLEQVSDVDNATIRRDIADTEAEISTMGKEVEGYRLLAEAQKGTPQGKMAAFRYDAKVIGINERSIMNVAAVTALLNEDIQNAVIASTPGGIERQEAEGQKSFVASTHLPLHFNSGKKEDLELFGVVFGNAVDDLFQEAQLPVGWKKEATDHSMWSKLVDEKGRERASIFYKAAFYDRSAHIDVNRVYQVMVEPVNGYDDENYREAEYVGVVKACGKEIWRTKPIEKEPPYSKENLEQWMAWNRKKDSLRTEAINWLNENFPEWESNTAYWGVV